MSFREYLKNNIVYLDGAMGTLLQKSGLKPGEHPERMNITAPEAVKAIHKAYFDAGSNVVCSNISRSVKATQKQIEAIRYIMDEDKLQRLGEELEYTARLRLENDSASLAELALMHVPPISKSGLNSRLARIVKVAGEIAKEKES